MFGDGVLQCFDEGALNAAPEPRSSERTEMFSKLNWNRGGFDSFTVWILCLDSVQKCFIRIFIIWNYMILNYFAHVYVLVKNHYERKGYDCLNKHMVFFVVVIIIIFILFLKMLLFLRQQPLFWPQKPCRHVAVPHVMSCPCTYARRALSPWSSRVSSLTALHSCSIFNLEVCGKWFKIEHIFYLM